MIELIVILALLVLNGVFAMAEIAIVSSKKARIKQWADEGNSSAKVVLQLTQNPERFLSTVQIGITLVGVFSGAFGGASLSAYLVPYLEKIPFLAENAASISFGVVVAFITYLSLIIGELVPKNLALRNPEKISLLMAKPMFLLSRFASPLVWMLEKSTRILMKILGPGSGNADGPSREEVQVLVREGIVTGGVEQEESDMVEGVFDLKGIVAEEIMRPRPKVTFLKADASHEQIWQLIANSKQSVFPVYQESRDRICGMVAVHSLYGSLVSTAGSQPLMELMKEPAYVSENQSALKLFETLRNTSLGAALVTDEFGTIRGLISLDDLVEEVVGDIKRSDLNDTPQLRKLTPDSWIIDGMIEIDEVVQVIPELETAVMAEQEPFQTLAGFIVHKLDRLPVEGEVFQTDELEFNIVDMDQQRIDKVLITRRAQEKDPDSNENSDV